ncbi:MAG TPA: YIP1 family protein [Kiritimatiellia bacterium]|nr:YIP1 family protein [Kiritimatiellia bacterium]
MEISEAKPSFDLDKIKNQALSVITTPATFFKGMAKGGGIQDPLIFLVAISVVTALVRALYMLVSGSFIGAIGVLILTPVMAAIFGFVGAAILYVIWNVMGSRENYETAYRCAAYASAIMPITTLISFIPYLGGVAAMAWGFYLIFLASVSVHNIPLPKAKLVWGILFTIFALFGFFSEVGARKAQKTLERWEQRVSSGEMSPEEAGRMVGEFLKGLEKAAQKQDESSTNQNK